MTLTKHEENVKVKVEVEEEEYKELDTSNSSNCSHKNKEPEVTQGEEEDSTSKSNEEQTDEKSSLWTPVWDSNAQAYYWWNTETNETTWINPTEPPIPTTTTTAATTTTTTTTTNAANPLDFLLDRIDNVVKKKLDDQSHTLDNDFSSSTSQYYDNDSPYSTTAATNYDPSSYYYDNNSHNQEGNYASHAHFNARTGRFTTDTDVNRLNPEYLSIESRATRQMQNFFDVDNYTEQRNAQIANGRVNKKRPLTRKEVEYFKKMKKEKKSKRAREWLLQ